MAGKRWTVLSVWLAVVGILLAGLSAMGRETEEQLLQRIQSQQNPVKKAKGEIKLANLKLTQVHDAYSQGHIEAGAKLLGTFVDTMKASWKLLQDSGRKASKQPEGFRELEIALRENVRLLQDLGRTVSYFDRPPLVNAAQELEQMRYEVLHALFPGGNPRTLKGSPPPQTTTSPGSPTEVR
ncbi:MAG: hypothetical protein ABSA59_14850 [Terriglobia bacterium]|jgi:hypothetical protein